MKDFAWITPKGDPLLLLSILGAVAVVVGLITFGSRCLRRWQKRRQFLKEIDDMALDEAEGDTLVGLVKRYATCEPLELLYCLRAFDELAQKEMKRVLALDVPQQAKQQYIDLLYTIRQKTYFSALSSEPGEPVPDGLAGHP